MQVEGAYLKPRLFLALRLWLFHKFFIASNRVNTSLDDVPSSFRVCGVHIQITVSFYLVYIFLRLRLQLKSVFQLRLQLFNNRHYFLENPDWSVGLSDWGLPASRNIISVRQLFISSNDDAV